MSFFKDFKADFTQAMNELMPDGNEVYDDDVIEEEVQETPSKPSKTKEEKASKQKPKKVKTKEKKTLKKKDETEDLIQDMLDEVQNMDDESPLRDMESVVEPTQNQDSLDIAPEDMSDQIDTLLDKELYGDDIFEPGYIHDDVDVNTMDMSVEELLRQLDANSKEQNEEPETFLGDLRGTDSDKRDEVSGETEELEEVLVEEDDSSNENNGFVAESTEDSLEKTLEEFMKESVQEPLEEPVSVQEEVSVENTEEPEEVPVEDILEEPEEVPVGDILEEPEEVPVEDISEEPEDVPVEDISEEPEEEPEEVPVEDILEEPEEVPVEDVTEEPEDVPAEGVTEEPVEESTEPLTDSLTAALINEEDTVTNSIVNVEDENMNEDKDVISIKPVDEKAAKPVVEETRYNVEEADSDTTYITKGTKISGSIETDASIDIIGVVEGDVNCKGKVVVGGAVKGAITAGELYCNSARIEGDIKSYGSVKVGVGSMIIGNVEGESAVIAGAVNGDIDVKGPVIVDSTAVIMGNIKSRSVQINNGAVIEGFCSQSYSDIDVKSFFA